MKNWKGHIVFAIVVVAVASILGGALAKPVWAQVRAALVKNVDQPGRMPYQQMIEFGSGAPHCLIAQKCVLNFSPVPAGKRLVVEQATIMIHVESAGEPNLFALGDGYATNSGNVAVMKPDFVSGESLFGGTFWFNDRPVRAYYEAGATPKLKVGFSAPLGILANNASLQGYLIDAAN